MFGDEDNAENSYIREKFEKELEGCRVPGTKHEYYDCCFNLTASTCRTFSLINLLILALAALIFLRLIFKSTWFRYNKLLMFTFLFQFAVLICRVVYMYHAGYTGASKLVYMVFKSGGPSDTVLSLTAFLLYLEQLTQKYEQKED